MPVDIDINALLEKTGVIARSGEPPRRFSGITQDSRLVQPGFIFAARSGDRTSGLKYIGEALKRGAALLITAEPLPVSPGLPAVQVADFRTALAELSREVYGDPSRRLNLVGITGTNGKTTTTYLVKSILEAAGECCGIIGTIGYDTGSHRLDAPLTTPDIDRSQALLSEMIESGCGWAVMEVSSHALQQDRLDGLQLTAAGFTNLSRDHLDYHGTLDTYAAAKAKLFTAVEPTGHAAVNVDDPRGGEMASACRCRVITCGGVDSGADVTYRMLRHGSDGGGYLLEYKGENFRVDTQLIGEYQGGNITIAAALAFGFGIDRETVRRGVAALAAVPGRMEPVDRGQSFQVFVDYSHTPDALEKALHSLRSIRPGRLVLVFGCGGDRDRAKRPEMGRIAAELADRVIITSDNPRSEPPEAIINEILTGVPGERRSSVRRMVDRTSAIRAAVVEADSGDVVLIAGKGHETYQEVKGVRHRFDDREIAGEIIQEFHGILGGRYGPVLRKGADPQGDSTGGRG